MFPPLIFPSLEKIITSTERSGSNFILFKLVLKMSNIVLKPDEQLSRLLSKIEKNKNPSKLEFLSTATQFEKLILKKSNKLAVFLAPLRAYKFTISDYRYNGNWSTFKAVMYGSQIYKISVFYPWTKYILGLCGKEKSALIAARKGKDINSFFKVLQEELLLDEVIIREYKILLEDLPREKSEYLNWSVDKQSQLTTFESNISVVNLMNTLAIFEAVMCIGRPYYILSNTIYGSILPKIHNNKLRLPCYFFVEHIKNHIESSINITEPFSSYEKLSESIEKQSGNESAYAETIKKMFTRWQTGQTPIKPDKVKEFVSCYTYRDKNNNLIFSIAPYIINYLTQSIIALQKSNSNAWIVEQFERYPLYRHKVFDQINECR